MTKLGFFAFPVVFLAVLQFGCAGMPGRSDTFRSSPQALRPACDTSVRRIDLLAMIQNDSDTDIAFNLVGDRGPPYDLLYIGYSVYSSAPGEPFELVHNSGQNAAYTRRVAIAPGNSAEFNTPVFGLRAADYHRYYRIELRDSDSRSYWTPVFELCSFARPAAGAAPNSAPRPAPPRAFRG